MNYLRTIRNLFLCSSGMFGLSATGFGQVGLVKRKKTCFKKKKVLFFNTCRSVFISACPIGNIQVTGLAVALKQSSKCELD